jgi:hypothetical protein
MNLSVTRRSSIKRLLFGLGGSAVLRAAGLPQTSRLTWDVAAASGTGAEGFAQRKERENSAQRTYRADAQITLFGLSFLHRSRVGGGSAVWRESSLPEGDLLRFLEFTGFSVPARAAGLNRLGFIREMSRLEEGSTAESVYFGLMTSSPEESAEEARKALDSHAKEVVYSAIEGRIARDALETVGAHFTAPAQWSVENREDLIKGARMALAGAPPKPPEGIDPAGIRALGSTTFLETLADVLRDANHNETQYIYNARLYHLHVTRAEDPKATSSFRQRGLIPPNAEVVRATGQLQRNGGKEQTFRLWFEAGAEKPVPLRIEYQAKSYLRLVFEAEG